MVKTKGEKKCSTRTDLFRANQKESSRDGERFGREVFARPAGAHPVLSLTPSQRGE